MKKIILTALLSALAFSATAQVTISGKIGEYLDSTKTGSSRVSSVTAEPTSNIKVTAQEDLGGGLKANVIVDTRIFANDPTTTDSQIGGRQSTVGLANKLGSVDLGRNVHSLFVNYIGNDPFGAMYGSIVEDVHSAQGKRFSNASFVTLTPVKGVTLSSERQANGTGQDGTSYGASATLMGATATYAKYSLGAEKSENVGLVTAFNKLRVNAMYSQDTVSNVAYVGKTVGAAYPVTDKITAKTSYGKRKGGTGEVSAYNVGFDYNFSKRTTGQVVYRNVDAPGTTADIKQVAVGMVHRF